MSRHHNCKHPERGRSNYGRRLAARGLSKAPALASVATLRTRQGRRVTDTCTLGPDHHAHTCDGQPYRIKSREENDDG